MKRILLPVITILLLISCNSGKDSVEQAQEQNMNSAIDEKISKFLTEAADASMAGIEQGKLAKERSQNAQVKQYGEWMISENNRILKELRLLAASKNITLPAAMSDRNLDQLEDLRDEEGEDFDEEFLKNMRRACKNEADSFEDAEDFNDKDVRKFATTYRPVIASHLEKLEQIEDQAERTGPVGETKNDE